MNQKIDDKKIIRANNLQNIQNYVDSYHAVHMEMMGNTGEVSTFGIGLLTANPIENKMNLRSSKKSEAIGNREYPLYNICCQ